MVAQRMSMVLEKLREKIGDALVRDQFQLMSRLNRIRDGDAAARQQLAQDIAQSVEKKRRRALGVPDFTYPEPLPIAQRAAEIEALIRTHQFIIVSGETGSGKTTQLPKICLAAGRGIAGLIGHTQPRRMAARAVATRIAQELNTPLGDVVGYKVRFHDKTSPNAYIKLMTDGILLAETQHDRWLSSYDTIIIDEAHERSLNIDFLLGFLKQLAGKRPELKIIITSATLDAERFARHFGTEEKPAPIIEVSGRTYPVTIRYRPLRDADDISESADDEQDMEEAIADAVEELWREGSGDILAFLPGEREIRETANVLRKLLYARPYAAQMEILPLFARLSVDEQQRIFTPSHGRRIVLATNVAETSLTVPGVRYVIDTGLARVKRYNPRNKTTLLRIEKIAQAAAQQRAGRCGRVADGICIRLYSEDDFNNRPSYTDPEILRSSLAAVILRMAALKLGSVENFPFIEPPAARAVTDGYQLLRELGAMDASGKITKLGYALARLPLDPRVGRIVLESQGKHCVSEMLIIASALAVPDPRERPFEKQQAADQAHARFHDDRSDFITLLSIWRFFSALLDERLSHRKTVDRCREVFINYLRMREWRDVHQQLVQTLKEDGWQWRDALDEPVSKEKYQVLHKVLLSGLLSNIGMRSEHDDSYQGMRGINFHLHPGSGIKKGARWLLSAELTETSRLFARCAARIEPEWIEDVAGDLVNREYYEPHWNEKRGEVTGYEHIRLFGLTLIGRRPISFTRVVPETAYRVFVREALATGNLRTRGKFLKYNIGLIEEITALEHKARRQDVLVDEETIADFYFERVPNTVATEKTFEHWREKIEKEKPQYLFLERDYLMRHSARWVTEDLFPPTIIVEEEALSIEYRFEPGHSCDGITVTAPIYLLNKIDPAPMSWLVPGMVREKLAWYIKALPKALRHRLSPVPPVITAFLEAAPYREKALAVVFSDWLRQTYQMQVSPADWHDKEMPEHLKMRYVVVDEERQELQSGRDLEALRQSLEETVRMSLGSDDETKTFEKRGITCWDFGELPGHIAIQRRGKPLTLYPALTDEDDSVSLRLFDTRQTADTETRCGVIRLMRLALKDLLRFWEKGSSGFQQSALLLKPFIATNCLLEDIFKAICDRAFVGDDPLPRNEKAFLEQIKRARARFPAVAEGAFRLLHEIAEENQQLTMRIQATPSTLKRFAGEIRAQRDALVYDGFFSATPWPQLACLPRYLKAMDRRMAKYAQRAQRDQKHGEHIAQLWQRYQERLARNKAMNMEEPALEMYRWMIEEMRVSLFAQELKTPYPISFQRIEKFWNDEIINR